ncbi:hypothetical protein BSL78_08823 [Apostichopus japonicus]|uniref:Uncharacterized protein n=1 Tax=Stichopus japonicus TaxID=307972 RepID=A0A2G8L257_STIJA|nr:hypothetical protein BSL78_08823 [Apostichopus japonicus]
MNQDIILNIQTFLKLLEAARCEAVSQWDEAAFKRALRWAEYAEQLYSKVYQKPEFLEKLKRVVKRIHETSQEHLGQREVAAEDLKCSKKLLLKILLENSHLPSQLYHQILPTVSQERHHSADLQDGLIGVDDFVEVTSKCATLKMTCKLLTKMDTSLEWVSTSDTANRMIGTAFFILSQQNPHGLEVIGSVLTLEMPDKTVHGDKMEQFIFDWLMSNKTQYIQKDPTPV